MGAASSAANLENSRSASAPGAGPSAEIISSARRARTGVGPTEPRATRVRPSDQRNTQAETMDMTMALRWPILANSERSGRSAGNSTAVISSSGRRRVCLTPVKNSSQGSRRAPEAERSSMRASKPARKGRASPAGLAVPMFPPKVAASRIWGEPMVRAIWARAL